MSKTYVLVSLLAALSAGLAATAMVDSPDEGVYSGVVQGLKRQGAAIVVTFRLTHEVPFDQLKGQITGGDFGAQAARVNFTAAFDKDANTVVFSEFQGPTGSRALSEGFKISGSYDPSARRFRLIWTSRTNAFGPRTVICKRSAGSGPSAEPLDVWSGLWRSTKDGRATIRLSGPRGSLSGSNDWVASPSNQVHFTLSNFKHLTATHLTCDAAGRYFDDDKSIDGKAKFDLRLEGDAIQVTFTPVSRVFHWNAGVTPYGSAFCSAVDHDTYKRVR